jgi:uroporphyrinogen III methyltransferase / synthase
MNAGSDPHAVVVTRAEAPDGPLSRALTGLGLKVLLWPAVNVVQAEPAALAAALRAIKSFDWIVFASRHAVAAVLGELPAAPPGLKIAAIGKATAQVLRRRGWPVDLVPDEASAAALVAAFGARVPTERAGLRVLYPASSRALPTIATGLRQLGAEVRQVEAYRTEGAALDVAHCRDWIARAGIAAVTFASPSAVDELAAALGAEDFTRLLSQASAVAIGRTTARALSAHGHQSVIAATATLEGLAATTHRLLQSRK